jgi:pimeloyl-ACP methyl ester carboxylesterase
MEKTVISTDVDREGDALLVFFSGGGKGMGGIPHVGFRKTTDCLPAKLAFVRDPSRSAYLGELPGIGRGHDDLAAAVTRVREEAGVSRVVCVGNSMGGYAALVVGSMIRADEVLAFSPQTFLTAWLRFRHWDRRWEGQMRRVRADPTINREAGDLRSYLAEPGYGKATIFADRSYRLDRIHALRVARLPRTSVRWVQGRHNVIRHLRNSGELVAILREACIAHRGARIGHSLSAVV